MKLDQLRDYLTLPDVATKWKATDPEMCRAILKGLLKPSVYLNQKLRRAEVAEDGSVQLVEAEPELVLGWNYLTGIQQVGALDCRVQMVSVVPDCLPGATVWALPEPLTMERLLSDAVVMAEDLAQAEERLEVQTHWQQRSGHTKEINSVLNTLSAVLADAYRFDPRVRSSIPREITEASERNGHALSQGTVTKWIREAIEQFPPSYMNEPVAKAKEAA